MKRYVFGGLVLSLCAVLAASAVSSGAGKKEAVFQAGDEELLLSDMPLTFYAGLQ